MNTLFSKLIELGFKDIREEIFEQLVRELEEIGIPLPKDSLLQVIQLPHSKVLVNKDEGFLILLQTTENHLEITCFSKELEKNMCVNR